VLHLVMFGRATLCASALFLSSLAVSGTIISTNLPTDTLIVNIDARADGVGNYDAGQDKWWDPYASGPVVALPAGIYSFQVINPSDAAATFPFLTSAQLNQIYTAWTYNSPWITDWMAWNTATISSHASQVISGGTVSRIPNYSTYPGWNGGGFNNATFAYSALTTSGCAKQIQIGGRYTGPNVKSIEFRSAISLQFAIPDTGVGDNTGGVSVVVRRVGIVRPTPIPTFGG